MRRVKGEQVDGSGQEQSNDQNRGRHSVEAAQQGPMLERTVHVKRKDPSKATEEKRRQIPWCGGRQHGTERHEPPFHHGGRPKERTTEPSM